MARQSMGVRKRIERQKEKIIKLTDELEQAQGEYEKLQDMGSSHLCIILLLITLKFCLVIICFGQHQQSLGFM